MPILGGKMMKSVCAFMYVAPGCTPVVQHALLSSESLDLHISGVSDYAQGEAEAKRLVENGCTVIELYAGFGHEGIARIQKAVGPKIAVGAVRFDFHPALEFKSGDQVF